MPVFHNLFSGNRNDTHFEKEDRDRNFGYNHIQEQDSSAESLAWLFSMEQHGDNYEEIAFTNRMKRKKKKPRGPKL